MPPCRNLDQSLKLKILKTWPVTLQPRNEENSEKSFFYFACSITLLPAKSLQRHKPRGFNSGIFKYRRTRGAVPADLDLLQTMKLGIPGTSMPGWDLLSMEDWRSILSYLKSFNPRLDNEKAGPSVDTPEEPKKTPESIQSGLELYEKSGCVACHGLQGKGDGPGAIVLKDVWGDRIAPRDLTRGPLKWGNTTRDIYRTLMIGIPGTPMPGYEHTFSKEQMC